MLQNIVYLEVFVLTGNLSGTEKRSSKYLSDYAPSFGSYLPSESMHQVLSAVAD